jgi:hypothetical protein
MQGPRDWSCPRRSTLPGSADLTAAARLRVALAAVIENDTGELSYWALQHAPGKPDFHHPDGFTLELSPP